MHHRRMATASGNVPLRIEMTIEQAAESWLSRYASANTRAAYSSDLKGFLIWLGDADAALAATPDTMQQYRAEREGSGVSESTIDRQFAALRAFYSSACELGIRLDNPLGLRRAATADTSATGTLTAGDVVQLEAAAAPDPRTTALIGLLLGAGMRLAEILGLDHADVAGPRHARRLHVVRHGEAVTVSLDGDRSRSVRALQQTTPSPGPLFVGPSRGRAGSTRLTRFGADHLLKQAAAAANIEQPVSANVLRRTHVFNARRAGVSLDDIRQTMGHRDVRTTRRYLDPTDEANPNQHPGRS